MTKRKTAPVKTLAVKKVLNKPAPKSIQEKPGLKTAKPSLKTTKKIILKKTPQPPLSKRKQPASLPPAKPKPQPSASSKAKPSKPFTKDPAPGLKKKLVLKKKLPKKAASSPTQQSMPASKQSFLAKNQGLSSKNAPPTKANPAAPPSISPTLKEKTKHLLLNARKRTATPTIFRTRQRKHTPILFTLEDVRNILQNKGPSVIPAPKKISALPPLKLAAPVYKVPVLEKKLPAQFFQAASVADILGFNPNSAKAVTAYEQEASKIPQKFKVYYRLLVDLRAHLQQEINLHSQNALNRSGKDETTENSSYSQHMADAGTDTFDRDFALSILSNEQDALFEIDEAIQRMIQGSYGVCEITGNPIPKERLLAVPFTRCSIEGQKELERNKHRTQRSSGVGVFAEVFDDEHGFSEDENNEV